MNDKYQTKFARLMMVARAIKEQKAVNRSDLSRICGGVAKGTISRYIRILRDVLGYPIVYNPQDYTYEYYREDYNKLDDYFTREEVLLLLMALDSVKSFSGIKITNLQKKLLGLLSNREDFDLEELSLQLDLIKPSCERGNIYCITDITKAMLAEKEIKFNYAPAYLEAEKMVCHVIPYGVNWDNDKCYLIGKDVNDEKIINYRLDRIDKMEVINKEGVIPKDFNLQDYLAQTWNMFFGPAENVVIKFSQVLRPVIKDNFVEGHYTLLEEDENYFIIESTIRGLKGFKIWLLGLGNNVEVLKPDSFRKEIKETVQKVAKKYE